MYQLVLIRFFLILNLFDIIWYRSIEIDLKAKKMEHFQNYFNLYHHITLLWYLYFISFELGIGIQFYAFIKLKKKQHKKFPCSQNKYIWVCYLHRNTRWTILKKKKLCENRRGAGKIQNTTHTFTIIINLTFNTFQLSKEDWFFYRKRFSSGRD